MTHHNTSSLKYFISLVAGALLFTVLFINFLISLCQLAIIKLIYWWWYSKSFNILWGPDAGFAYQGHSVFTSKESVSQSSLLMCISGPLDIRLWRERFMKYVIPTSTSHEWDKVYEKAKMRIVRKWRYFIWEEDANFCIDNHIREYAEEYEDDDSLMKIVQKIYQQPFPKDHPLWEVLLIRKKAQDEYIGCFRIHHSLADGTLMTLLLMSCTDESTKQKVAEYSKIYVMNPEKLSPLIKYNPLVHYLAIKDKDQKLTVQTILTIVITTLKGIMEASYLAFEAIMHKEKNNLHGAELTGRKILAKSENLDLTLFKEIALARKCSVNDVFNCCIAGAFRKEDPDSSSIRIVCPVGGLMPGKFGTQNSMTVSHYDIDLKSQCRLDRLKEVSETLQRFKESPTLLGMLLLSFLISNHAPVVVTTALFQIVEGTLMLTNLSGIPFQVTFNGHLVKDIMFFPINVGKNVGVSISCLSTFGQVRLGAVIDRAVAPDDLIADRFLKNVAEELRLLHAAAIS